MVGSLAMQAVAADPATHSTLSTAANAIQKPALKTQAHFLQPPTVDKYHIDHVGRMSSRPWTAVSGWPQTAPFVDDRPYNAEFRLFTVGF